MGKQQADIVLRGGLIVDGTGQPGFRGDVAVTGDRITAVGRFDGTGLQEIDASGKVVCPGFIDIHTHYDAQLCWDRLATPCLEHGVTTIVIGNCSLSLAPIADRPAIDKIVDMFWVIEDIGADTFEAGVPWRWTSFGDYLRDIEQGLGINVRAFVGHSVLRWFVMGADAQERAATGDEIAEMAALLRAAMAAGAGGISTSYVDTDSTGRPVPSRFSEADERLALATVVAETGGIYQAVVAFIDADQQAADVTDLGEISRRTGVTVSIQPLVFDASKPDAWSRTLKLIEDINGSGGRIYGQAMPSPADIHVRISETSFVLRIAAGWRDMLNQPVAERIRRLTDPQSRAALVAEADSVLAPFLAMMRVGEVFNPLNRPYQGRTLVDIATGLEITPAEAMVRIALRDDLKSEFRIDLPVQRDEDKVVQILKHPMCHIGASDNGAHNAQFTGAGDTLYLLSRFVRERKDFPLEWAIWRLTGELADAWNIAGRGKVEAGRMADLVVLDPETVERGPLRFIYDMPGGPGRYVRSPTGVDAVILNGRIAVQNGNYTDARAGVIV